MPVADSTHHGKGPSGIGSSSTFTDRVSPEPASKVTFIAGYDASTFTSWMRCILHPTAGGLPVDVRTASRVVQFVTIQSTQILKVYYETPSVTFASTAPQLRISGSQLSISVPAIAEYAE